jgi:hypothetical protein
MQKSDLLTMYNVDTTNPYLSPKPPNQIIVKQDVTPIISTFDCPVSTINRITFLGLDTQSYGGNNYYGISIFVNVGTVSGTVPIQFSVDNYYSSGYLQVIYGGIATHIQDVTSTNSTITANYTYTYNPSNGTVIEINFVPYT